MTRFAFFIALLAFAAPAHAAPPPAMLTGGDWALATIDGKPVTARRAPHLSITGDGRMAGFAGCNRFTGSLDFTGPRVRPKAGIGVTRMACVPEAMALEQTFTRALQAVTGWSHADGALTLTGPRGTLVFRRVA